jgi:hypothetical protein
MPRTRAFMACLICGALTQVLLMGVHVAGADAGAGVPVRLQIPSIAVDAPIEAVGLTADGLMDVPKQYDDVGWYALGPRPGDLGNAVIAGHVDSTSGPAIFWRLRRLVPGQEIGVVGDDGVIHEFVVTAVARYRRTDAPLERIFGATAGTHLNLITCDSDTSFDAQSDEYAGSIVVYTDLLA